MYSNQMRQRQEELKKEIRIGIAAQLICCETPQQSSGNNKFDNLP